MLYKAQHSSLMEMEALHERNAHHFPLNLASAEAVSVALTAPAINGYPASDRI